MVSGLKMQGLGSEQTDFNSSGGGGKLSILGFLFEVDVKGRVDSSSFGEDGHAITAPGPCKSTNNKKPPPATRRHCCCLCCPAATQSCQK